MGESKRKRIALEEADSLALLLIEAPQGLNLRQMIGAMPMTPATEVLETIRFKDEHVVDVARAQARAAIAWFNRS